jgi:SAM-dependent methyltransferase
MSSTEAPVDVDVLRDEIRKTYTDVSTDAEQDFIFPTGRAWAEDLGYPQPELSRVPEATVESFAGVANHWTLGRIEPGSVVLDLGCGAGTDLLIAAQMTGRSGRVIGVDMTTSMLDRSRAGARDGHRPPRAVRVAHRGAPAQRPFRVVISQRRDRPRAGQGRRLSTACCVRTGDCSSPTW